MNLTEFKSGQNTAKMPLLFLGHGSPLNAIEENDFVKGFRKISSEIGKPKAILCISAHWETRGTYVTAMEKPQTIHDFSGFPQALYNVQYPAPGSPALAEELKNIVSKTPVEPDYDWGLDHGTWSVIRHIFPLADVPVIQLSLDYGKTPQHHYELAKEVAPLREKGVLIVGSGNMVHNLARIAWERLNDYNFGYEWALEAAGKMKQFILEGDHQSLIDYSRQGEAFRMAIPTPEHYLPLLYTLALKDKNEEIEIFNDKPVAGSLTMTSLKIGV
jgi:4,5-DOPA dioxygenase extradiol